MRLKLIAVALLSAALAAPVATQAAESRPYKVEWVYKVRYGFQSEWWALFQKDQIPTLDRSKALGYVTDYVVYRPGLHTSDDARWDYRIEITYPNHEASTHEAEIEAALYPDKAAFARDEQRRWELTVNHWDLPIHSIDPHAR